MMLYVFFKNMLEKNEMGFQKCLLIECCPLYGIEFTLVWVSKIIYNKHVYHC
jgi:hypothetical protein